MPPAPSIRIVMLGTGDFALPTLLELCDTGHEIVTLITQPDRPQGRKQELIPSAIKRAAVDRRIPVFQPEDVNAAESLETIRPLAPELLVTAAYGQILSAELLGIPRLGGINLHGSILPAYRGAAPVARAIANGEVETGVTVIRMTPRIDAGGMLGVARTAIGPDETAGELEDRLARIGAPMVVQAIAGVAAGSAEVLLQENAKATRAPKLRKQDGLIDWTKPARSIHDLVRAMQPWPTAYTFLQRALEKPTDPTRVMIHRTTPVDTSKSGLPGEVVEAEGDTLIVKAGAGAVRILRLQVPGRNPVATAEFLRGRHDSLVGRFFGD